MGSGSAAVGETQFLRSQQMVLAALAAVDFQNVGLAGREQVPSHALMEFFAFQPGLPLPDHLALRVLEEPLGAC